MEALSHRFVQSRMPSFETGKPTLVSMLSSRDGFSFKFRYSCSFLTINVPPRMVPLIATDPAAWPAEGTSAVSDLLLYT